jgi:hypothetical protein
MKPPTYTISFRVDGRLLKRLEADASSCNLSLHADARRLVQEVLEDTERERVREEIAATRAEVAQLREDLATALEMILLNLTQVGEEEIRAWVSRNLRRAPGSSGR